MEKISLIFGLLLLFVVNSNLQISTHRRFGHHALIYFTRGWWFWQNRCYCSGAIIGENWILTLSGCYKKNYKITVYIGSDFFSEGIERECLEIITEEFMPFALIRTEEIIFTNFHRYLPLPNEVYRKSGFFGKRCYFSGWGALEDNLGNGEVTIMEPSKCFWGPTNHLCGRFISDGESVINPGSPLVYRSPDGPLLIGLFDGTRGGIGVFFSLSFLRYIDWIENKTQLSLQLTSYP